MRKTDEISNSRSGSAHCKLYCGKGTSSPIILHVAGGIIMKTQHGLSLIYIELIFKRIKLILGMILTNVACAASWYYENTWAIISNDWIQSCLNIYPIKVNKKWIFLFPKDEVIQHSLQYCTLLVLHILNLCTSVTISKARPLSRLYQQVNMKSNQGAKSCVPKQEAPNGAIIWSVLWKQFR